MSGFNGIDCPFSNLITKPITKYFVDNKYNH